MLYDPSEVSPLTSHHINGEQWVTPGNRFEIRSPSNPSIAFGIPVASHENVSEAVAAARQAFRTSDWFRGGPRQRAEKLHRWAALVDEHAPEIAVLESIVSSRPYLEVMARDVKVVSGVLRYFAEFADKTEGSVTSTPPDALSLTVHEPYGVVAAISPWNFPIILAAWKFAPALAAGNAVVLKPSELTPFAILRIAELSAQAGLPPGIFNVVLGDGKTGQALVRNNGVDYVTFTGSTATGKSVMSDAALHGLKPVSLELGGKGPHLVFDDAPDIDRIAQLITRGVIYNSGQACFSGSRLVVQRGVRDQLIDKVIAKMKDAKPGETWNRDTTLPPVINDRQLSRINAIVSDGVAAGAQAQCGGQVLEGPNGAHFFQPTVLRNVARNNVAFTEEIFGPVLVVEEFDEPEDGINLANHPEYGLTASVYSRDITRALKAARNIESGTVWVNDWGRRTDLTSPFGGFKRSGIGKDMGRPGFEKYLKSKSIWVDLAH